MIKFEERLFELRKERGISRKALAEAIGVNLRTIGYWEQGQRECNLEQLARLARYFYVTTDYLLGLED